MATTFDVLYLGTIASLDPTEGNITAENAGVIVGSTFGSVGDPLYNHIQTFSPGTVGYTGGSLPDAYDVDNALINEQFRIDGGVNQTIDTAIVYDATVTYIDGTTGTITAVVFQDTAGRFYLAPEVTANADQAVLEALPIRSLTLNAVSSSATLLTADRDIADFLEVVNGTAGSDAMSPGYTDANGDQIDGADGNDDYIDAGAGNDTVNAGLGNDIVHGGDGDDSLTGGAGNDTLYGDAGLDTFLFGNGWGADFVYGGTSVGEGNDDALNFSGVTLGGVTVSFTGSEDGTATQGGNTVTFDDIERVFGSNLADTINAGADASGLDLYGQGGDDTITGGSGADLISGGTGNDTLSAGLGNDTVYGDDGADQIHGGDGVDTVYGGTGNDTIWGDTGNDILNGEIGADTIWGGDGADTINGGLDNDILAGESGDDTFLYWDYALGWGADTVTGGETGETLGDTLDFSAVAEHLTVTYSGSEAGTATDGANTVGFTQIERLVLGSGNDFVDAGASTASFTLWAMAGDDHVEGTLGNDTIHGGDGADGIFGDNGADLIYGDAGDDDLGGDAGNDTIWGGTGDDWIQGNQGINTLQGESGDDTFEVFTGQGGVDTITGGETGETAGDTLLFTGTGAVSLSFGGDEAGSYTAGSASGTFSEIENLVLTDQADSVDARADGSGLGIATLGGDDLVHGGTGDDVIDTGDDADRVYLHDDFGADVIDGGEGGTDSDTLDAGAVTGDVTLTLSGAESGTLGAGGDTASFAGFEAFVTGAGDDTVDLWANTGGTTVATGSGADTVISGQGDDSIDLGAGAADGAVDTVVLRDGAGNDTVFHFDAPVDNGDGTFTGVDQLDVSGLTSDGGTTPVTANDVTVSDDGSGNAVLSFPGGESVVLVGIAPALFSDVDALVALGIPDGRDHIVEGTAGNDLITGTYTGDPEGDLVDAGDSLLGNDDDVIYGYDGNDIVQAGDGNDVVYGGTGNDELYGDAGNDTLDGGDGDDALYGGLGDDTITGGDGADTIFASGGTDYIDAGAGNDDIRFTGSDTVLGGDGDDLFRADALTLDGTPVSITGGEGAETAGDTLTSGTYTGDVTVDFSAGDPASGEDGTMQLGSTTVTFNEIELVKTGAGNDTVIGSSGADRVDTGAGADTIDGGAGNDTITAGTGDDTITGGDGNDTFVYTAGDGADTITDFNTGNTGTLADGDSTNNDFIDLSGFYDNIWELHADQADDGVLNQSNDGVGGVDYSDNTRFQPGDSLTFTGASADGSSFTVENTGVICFARGTLILTPGGEVPVERLRAGDLVVTADHGAQRVRWIGSTRVARTPELQPIRIARGALGTGLPTRTLYVSPQHRMMLRSRVAARMTGGREVLVAACKLVGLRGIHPDSRAGHVRYFHLLCDRHEIVYANGAPAETLLPGPGARVAMGADAWAEITAIFPDIEETQRHLVPARTVVPVPHQDRLARRHRRNRVPLLEPAD